MNARLRVPDVPTTGNEYVPGVTLGPTVNVKVLDAEPLAGGVTGLGANARITPAGAPWQLRLTALVNPLSDDTVITLDVLPLCVALNVAGAAEILNPGSDDTQYRPPVAV
jgi:hypothetical protein